MWRKKGEKMISSTISLNVIINTSCQLSAVIVIILLFFSPPAAQDQDIEVIRTVAQPTLGQITVPHQPLTVWTPCQGAITTSPHRRGPDGQVYCFWFPSLLLPLSSPRSVLQALCSVKWSAMINCAENFSEGLKWSSVAPVCLLNFLTFLRAERQMAALYGTALSSLIVNIVAV